MNGDRNDATAADRMRRYRARQAGEDIPRQKPGPKPRTPQVMIPASPARGYALDFTSPVEHVTAELGKAGPRGATVREMTLTYRHVITGDLARVRLHHGLGSDSDARLFLIDRAVSALWAQGQIRQARRQGAYRLHG